MFREEDDMGCENPPGQLAHGNAKPLGFLNILPFPDFTAVARGYSSKALWKKNVL